MLIDEHSRSLLCMRSDVDLQVADRLAFLRAHFAWKEDFAADEPQVVHQLGFLEKHLSTMITFELLQAASLHMCELLVDRREFHFAEGALEREIRKQLRVLVHEMVTEKRDSFESRKDALVDWAGKVGRVSHEKVKAARRLLREPLRTMTAVPGETFNLTIVGWLNWWNDQTLSVQDHRSGFHLDGMNDILSLMLRQMLPQR